MLHELGHMLGLDHNFNGMSVMNYFPSEFRFFAMPYMDDAAGIRALHPGNAVSRTDLGVYLYYVSGYQNVTDATYPASVVAGGSLTVNNYTIENVGTTAFSTPTIERVPDGWAQLRFRLLPPGRLDIQSCTWGVQLLQPRHGAADFYRSLECAGGFLLLDRVHPE